MSGTLTIEQAAELLNISKRHMDTLVRGGMVPGTKIGRQWVFSKAQLIRYIEERAEKNLRQADIKTPSTTKRRRRRNASFSNPNPE